MVAGILVGLFLLSILMRWKTQRQEAPEPIPVPQVPVRVRVVNGCGKQGLASVFAHKLRRFTQGKVDVVISESPRSLDAASTVIVAHGDASSLVPFVARVVGCDSTVTDRPDSVVDVTIILGSDYRRLFPGRARWWETP